MTSCILDKVFQSLLIFIHLLRAEAYIVIVMYQKTTAKNGRHEPADVTSNITALSKIILQVFEHSSHGAQFHSIPEVTALLQLHQYVLLPPTSFLTLLNAQLLKVNNSGFKFSPVDMVLFNDLKRGKEQLRKAMKAFRKCQKAEDSV